MNAALLGAVAVTVGVWTGDRMGPGSGVTVAATAAALCVLTICTRDARVRRLATGVVLGLLGAALMQRALDGVAHHSMTHAVAARSPVVVEGTLASDPRDVHHVASALLRVDRWKPDRPASGWTPLHRTLAVRAADRSGSRLRVLRAGDHVRLRGDLAPLRPYDTTAATRHAVARLDVVEVDAFSAASAPWWRCANALRSMVERGTRSLDPQTQALLLGFVLGDTRAVPSATVDAFRAAGLTHLLAVSGANVAFVLVVVTPVLRRLPIVARSLGALGVVALFALVTRLEPSVLRAAAMAAVVLGAQLVGRPVEARRVLGTAVMGLLLVDPFLVHAPGFWLSAGACAGIVLTSKPIEQWLRGPIWLRRMLAVTFAAQLGVLPVSLAVFGTVSWVAPAANLFAVPVAEPVTVLAIPVAVLASVWAPLGRVALMPVDWMLMWVRLVAQAAARRPVAVGVAAAAFAVACGVGAALLRGPSPPVESPR